MTARRPKARPTDPVVASKIAASLTREELAGAIRTLVAMAACWELRDPAPTDPDDLQAAKLRQIIDLLREAADAQSESAERILATLMRDELAVALGAQSRQVVDLRETEGPDTGDITQVVMTPGGQIPPHPASLQHVGFRHVLTARMAREPKLPHTRWSEAADAAASTGEEDRLVAALRSCHAIVEFLLTRRGLPLDGETAARVAADIRSRYGTAKQGFMEAASSALYLFHSRDRPDALSTKELVEGTKALHNKVSLYLTRERHPDLPGLDSDAVDTGWFFGARNRVIAPLNLPMSLAPIEATAVGLIGAALLKADDPALNSLFYTIQSKFGDLLTAAGRGAGFRAHGAVPPDLLQVLLSDSASNAPLGS